MPNRDSKWLKDSEAAEALAVDVRTIKRWKCDRAKREAILAVRHGKQWRIPRPDNLRDWEIETRRRLERLGIHLDPAWKHKLKRAAKQSSRYLPEVFRLYLAASAKALSRGRMTEKAKLGIDLLWRGALAVMESEKWYLGVDAIKHKLPRELWRYWPHERHFKAIRDRDTRKAIEVERRRLDFTQAVRVLHRRGRASTAENLCPLLHVDWLAHVNDTKEKLPSNAIDFRRPQLGISLNQFRRRYPLRRKPWCLIIATVGGHSETSGADERPHTGQTPVRKPSYDGPPH